MTRPLEIAVAGRALGYAVGGVGAYARAITRAMLALGAPHRFTIYHDDSGAVGLFAPAREVYLEASHKFWWDHWALPKRLRIDQPDVVWFPHNVVALAQSCPAVVTICDLLYFWNPAHPIREYAFLDTVYMRLFIRRSVRKARRVVTISDWTASEVQRLLGVAPARLRTIHLAAAPGFRPLPREDLDGVKQRYGLERPFFLYVGGLSARKNLRRLLEAFASIRGGVPHDLVITGAGYVPPVGLSDLIDKHALGDRLRHLGLVPEDDLVALYNLAEALVFPSLYEGFGLPPLEAFACDCPVISSSVTALKEVVGDAAVLVDPNDAGTIARAMQAMAVDEDLRRRMIEAGRRQARKFSWPKSAKALLEELELAAD